MVSPMYHVTEVKQLLFFFYHFMQTGPMGRVVGIEHIDELVQMSIKNVQADDPELLSSGRIKLVGESGDVKVMPLLSIEI